MQQFVISRNDKMKHRRLLPFSAVYGVFLILTYLVIPATFTFMYSAKFTVPS